MSSDAIAGVTLLSFEEFVVASSPEELPPRQHRCLADYIRSWVASGYGVRVCQGDFQTLLIAVIAIIERWREDPGILYYVTDQDPDTSKRETITRRVTSIFGVADFKHDILDPYFLAAQTFRELYGDRPICK